MQKPSLIDHLFLSFLIFVPITLIAAYVLQLPLAVFFLAVLAIIPLAKYIGQATEELAAHMGPAFGGLLNATFGNAPELLIGIFALQAGFIEVVKASIAGSIIGNLLLVLGMAMLAGGLQYKNQSFNKTGALAASSTLLLSAIALVMPAIFLQTAPATGIASTEELSVLVAVSMLVVYAANLFFTLFTHKHLYIQEIGKYQAKWSKQKSIIVLLVSTAFVAWMSELLVGSLRPVVEHLGWTELFIGVVFIAIIGNAAEHVSAITTAMHNRMDLALQISIGSATQVAMVVAPLLVMISLSFAKPMNL